MRRREDLETCESERFRAEAESGAAAELIDPCQFRVLDRNIFVDTASN